MSTSRDIDRIADVFEAAWQAGENPSIADFVARIDEPFQSELLAALVPLDVTYCRQLNEPCEADDYSVFGDDAVAIARRELGKATTAELDETIQSDGQSQITNHSDATAGDRVQYFGEYELLSEIARGGMGVVYKARQVKLNRLVALKMILSGQLAGEQELKRFQAEAEAAAKLDHPSLVPIFEIGEHDGRHFIAMAYVEGRSLAAKLRDEGPMRPKEAAQLVRKITDAIHYAHLKGVVHRDLKPGNVLLDTNGEPRVTDFGLAKQVDTDSELTASGQVLGTPSYMPPEQAAGKLSDIGPASDIYSLGAILYACLTGRPPFQGASPTDVILQVLNDTPPAPRTVNRKVDRDLNTIVMKCLDKPISGRYPKAAYLRGDLDHYLRGEPIQARPIGRIARTVRWSFHHKRMSALIVALTISLLYPLFIGVADVLANLDTIRQWYALAGKFDGDLVIGHYEQMKMTNDEGNVSTEKVLVVPGVRSMQLEEVEDLVEAACNRAVVLRFISGRDDLTHYRKGCLLKVWIEVEKDGKSETMFETEWDMRATTDSPESKVGTLVFLRHEQQEDGSEYWQFQESMEVTKLTKSDSKERKSKSLIAESEFSMQSNHTEASSESSKMSRGVDLWSGAAKISIDEALSFIEKRIGLTDEERAAFTKEMTGQVVKKHHGERYSVHIGNHTETDKDIALYELSGGHFKYLSFWRSKHKLPPKPDLFEAIIRVKCRLLADDGEAIEPPPENSLKKSLDQGMQGSKRKPQDYYRSGHGKYAIKKYAEAIKDLTLAIENSQEKQESYHTRAHCYQALGEHASALSDLQWLIRFVPEKTHYHDMMSSALYGLGRDDEAKQAAQKSIEMSQAAFGKSATDSNKEDLAKSLNSLAWTLATSNRDSIRDPDEAVKLATRACELDGWKQWSHIDTLAAAYAASGDFPAAIKWQKKSLVAVSESLDSKDREEIAKRLSLYQSGVPYIDDVIVTADPERAKAASNPNAIVPEGHDNLLTSVDLKTNWTRGKWNLKDSFLESVDDDASIEVPYELPEQYEMTVIAEPLDKPNSLLISGRTGDQPFTVSLATTGMNYIESKDGGKFASEGGLKAKPLLKNVESKIVIRVADGVTEVAVDDEKLIRFDGDAETLADYQRSPNKQLFSIHTNGCRYRIHRLSVQPIVGSGTVVDHKTLAGGDESLPPLSVTPAEAKADKILTPLELRFEKPVPIFENHTPITLNSHATTRCFDWDADGDTDLLVGAGDGRLWLFRNLGTIQETRFDRREPITAGDCQRWGDSYTGVVFVHVIGDELPDLVVGHSGKRVSIHENVGTESEPSFQTEAFELEVQGSCDGAIEAADWDGDGLVDIITGQHHGPIKWHRNQGTAKDPKFESGEGVPFFDISLTYNSQPRIVDVDGDRRLDLLGGMNWGDVAYYRNEGDKDSPKLADKAHLLFTDGSKLAIRNLNNDDTTPELADLDGDGIRDLISGGYNGRVWFMKGVQVPERNTELDDLFGKR